MNKAIQVRIRAFKIYVPLNKKLKSAQEQMHYALDFLFTFCKTNTATI